jgi:ABC-type nickel/cobalt efflux system permease component RcnA
VALSVAAFAATTVLAPPASAHPLGNFTVNRYGGIVVGPGRVELTYVVDMAEIPTFLALPDIDTDGDGAATPLELQGWADAAAPGLADGISLSVDGRDVALRVEQTSASLLPGQGGLQILSLRALFSGHTGATRGRIDYADGNFADRIGWKEVTARPGEGVALTGSTVPEATISGELRSYPADLLASPPDVTEASLSFRPGTGVAPSGGAQVERSVPPAPPDGAFAALVARDLSLPAVLVGLMLAFGFGAVHALGPGHGKTIMAAYLVGTGARVRQALAVGIAVTLMHTASVIGLGLAALYASRLFPSDRVYPWLALVASLVVLALGATLLVTRMRARREGAAARHGHVHPHPHPHPDPAGTHQGALSRRGLAALAISGGLLPSPTALVVLLGAISLHRLGYGLALIGAFSLGLAAALMTVGILALRARSMVSRHVGGRVAGWLPMASAAAIMAAGMVLVVRAIPPLA